MKRWTLTDWERWGREMRIMCDTIDADGERMGAATPEEVWTIERGLGDWTDLTPAEEPAGRAAFIAGWESVR